MKLKTSITLSEDISEYIARTARKGESRSEAIERLLHDAMEYHSRRAREEKDMQILDKHSAELNREADEVLEYQVEV